MADGGFSVKFGSRKVVRCYAAAFDYDEGWYKLNNDKKKKLPPVKRITIEVEEG